MSGECEAVLGDTKGDNEVLATELHRPRHDLIKIGGDCTVYRLLPRTEEFPEPYSQDNGTDGYQGREDGDRE